MTNLELPLIFVVCKHEPKFLKFGPGFDLFSPLFRFLVPFSSSSGFLLSITKTSGFSDRTELSANVWWLTVSLTLQEFDLSWNTTNIE